jgi:hypothetical protein
MSEYEIVFLCLWKEETFLATKKFCGKGLIDACELAERDMQQGFDKLGHHFVSEIIKVKKL